VARTLGKIGVYRSGTWILGWNGNRRWDAWRPPIRFRDSHGLAAHCGVVSTYRLGAVPDSYPCLGMRADRRTKASGP
jgi:hypothetical protein